MFQCEGWFGVIWSATWQCPRLDRLAKPGEMLLLSVYHLLSRQSLDLPDYLRRETFCLLDVVDQLPVFDSI